VGVPEVTEGFTCGVDLVLLEQTLEGKRHLSNPERRVHQPPTNPPVFAYVLSKG
jgi:hypothetical protein